MTPGLGMRPSRGGREERGEGNEEEGYVASMDRSTYVVVQYVYAWIVRI